MEHHKETSTATRGSTRDLAQQGRAQALVSLAGGIFHNLNNLLSPITGLAEMNAERLDTMRARLAATSMEDEELRRGLLRLLEDLGGDLADIESAGMHIGAIVKRMRTLAHSREDRREQGLVRLDQVVRDAVQLTRSEWYHGSLSRGVTVDVHVAAPNEMPLIQGHAGELHEAVTNLILNGVAAMPKGGVLTLRAWAEGGQAFIEVTDTGVGMDAETQRRCLEPFFTTRQEGTGLGLSTVAATVHEHLGDLGIESHPGQGTRIRLAFPLDPSQLALPPSTPGVSPPLRALRILCVDDEAQPLRVLCDMLRHLGHEAVCADGGRGGIEAFADSMMDSCNFDLVITDLGMPRVSGQEVAKFVKGASPRTPVVLLSGAGAMPVEDVSRFADLYLNKPLRLSELREALLRVTEAG